MSRQKKSHDGPDLQGLEHEYGSVHYTAKRFCEELSSQLHRLLEDAGIALGFPIQKRVKNWSSLAEKLDRVPLHINSVREVQDLVGLRIILLFDRDAKRVNELITENFTVVKQYNTQERLNEDQFGYSSRHFVVKLPKGWLAVPTLAQMSDWRAEVQVRTLAQHIWAEASQNLQYKQEENVPSAVRRAIYRVSALLETIDLEFERVLAERENYRTKVDVSVTDEVLNVDLLEKTLDSMLPAPNKRGNEDYSQLLKELAYFDITKPPELEVLLTKHLDAVLQEEAETVEVASKRLRAGERVTGTTPERVKNGVYYTHAGLMRKVLVREYGEARFEEFRRRRTYEL